jgi:hypothetical protein
MKRFAAVCLFIAVFSVTAFAEEAAAPQAKTFGKAPTLTESVAISKLNSTPADYVDKNVLVTGKIVDMCRHSGCWVEIEAADSSRIICKSLDESVHFTTDCIGKQVALQGKLMFDGKAPGAVEKKHEGEAAHSCPAPKVLVSIEGASVNMAAAPVAKEGSK